MSLESDESLGFKDEMSLIVTNCGFFPIIAPAENLIAEEFVPVLESILQ